MRSDPRLQKYCWQDAIRGGCVVALGPVADVHVLAGPETTVWQLPPTLAVTPSFTDAHLHLATAALAAEQPDLTGLDRAGVEAVVAEIHRERLESGDADGWLRAPGL